MAVEYSKQSNVLKARYRWICNISIFHVSSPTLHFADRDSEVFIFEEGGFFVSYRFLEEGRIAHFKFADYIQGN